MKAIYKFTTYSALSSEIKLLENPVFMRYNRVYYKIITNMSPLFTGDLGEYDC